MPPTSKSFVHCNQILSRNKLALLLLPPQPPVGYPWTRLGYTYNWKPGADKYGASEYVIEPGSTVTILDIIPYKEYCSAKTKQ